MTDGSTSWSGSPLVVVGHHRPLFHSTQTAQRIDRTDDALPIDLQQGSESANGPAQDRGGHNAVSTLRGLTLRPPGRRHEIWGARREKLRVLSNLQLSQDDLVS